MLDCSRRHRTQRFGEDRSVRDRAGTVAVVGGGTMGAGIAQVAAAAGHLVLLHDARARCRRAGDRRHRRGAGPARRPGQAGREASAPRCSAGSSGLRHLADLAPAGLVVEAIVEDLGGQAAAVRRARGRARHRRDPRHQHLVAVRHGDRQRPAAARAARRDALLQPGAGDGAGRGGERRGDRSGAWPRPCSPSPPPGARPRCTPVDARLHRQPRRPAVLRRGAARAGRGRRATRRRSTR